MIDVVPIAVLMIPGHSAVTWMPRGASSALSASLIPTTPNFDAQYGAIRASGISPSPEAVLTMWAPGPGPGRRGAQGERAGAPAGRVPSVTRRQPAPGV